MTDLAITEADDERDIGKPRKPGLWVTDEELIRRSGVPYKIAKDAIAVLDANPKSGFPQKQALWGHRRYWPAVKAYWERVNGLNPQAYTQPLRNARIAYIEDHGKAKGAHDRRSV